MTLRDMQVGDAGRVAGFGAGARSYRRKLLSMGLTPGTPFNITRVAPMGDPIEIGIRGFKLTLRRHEADAIRVEKIS